MTRSAQRGYSLLMVLGLLVLVTVGVFGYISAVGTGARATGAAVVERRVFYAADDMCRITAVLAQNYLTSTAAPSAPDLEAFVQAAGGGPRLPIITPPDFETRGEVDADRGFEVFNLGIAETKPLPSGPFEGMIARQRPLDMKVRVQQKAGNAAAACRQKVVLATVAAFQFFIFSEVYLDWDPFPLMEVRGRVHSNEDVCVAGADGSDKGLKADRLTTASRILKSSNPARVGVGLCRSSQSKNNVQFATDGTFSTFALLDKDNLDVGWKEFAENTFNGRVLDSAHGVGKLKLPITGAPRVQAGYNLAVTSFGKGESVYKEPNVGNQRFVVDPILRNEPPDVREQKFAFKSDVRIVNGVWYIRDRSSPEQPGVPVWSDHPGTHAITGTTDDSNEQGHELFLPGDKVGQEDLRSSRGWVNTPTRFSYYGYETAGSGRMTRAANDPPAIISYGTLFRDADDGVGGRPYWYPGHWFDNQPGSAGTSLCAKPSSSKACTDNIDGAESDSDGRLDGVTSGQRFFFDNQCLARADGPQADNCGGHHQALINGTRSGFKSGWIEVRSKPSSATAMSLNKDQTTPTPKALNIGTGVTQNERDRSRILPINVDVAALQAALADCTRGELGSYFPGTCGGGRGREFNGIVYVTATWPGSLQGLGADKASSSFPLDWPYQGLKTASLAPGAPKATTDDPEQFIDPIEGHVPLYQDPNIVHNELLQNKALPYPLCSNDGSLSAEQRELNKEKDKATQFIIPRCSKYGREAGQIGAFPNAVRVINGAFINPKATVTTAGGSLSLKAGILPRGLTIATNLPMYVLGDVNIETTPKLTPTTTPTNDYFVPVLFAAARITRHS